jgi:hypothetical protein
VSIEGSGLKVDKDEMEFAHQFFLMEHPYLLEHIKRKVRGFDVLQGCAIYISKNICGSSAEV